MRRPGEEGGTAMSGAVGLTFVRAFEPRKPATPRNGEQAIRRHTFVPFCSKANPRNPASAHCKAHSFESRLLTPPRAVSCHHIFRYQTPVPSKWLPTCTRVLFREQAQCVSQREGFLLTKEKPVAGPTMRCPSCTWTGLTCRGLRRGRCRGSTWEECFPGL